MWQIYSEPAGTEGDRHRKSRLPGLAMNKIATERGGRLPCSPPRPFARICRTVRTRDRIAPRAATGSVDWLARLKIPSLPPPAAASSGPVFLHVTECRCNASPDHSLRKQHVDFRLRHSDLFESRSRLYVSRTLFCVPRRCQEATFWRRFVRLSRSR